VEDKPQVTDIRSESRFLPTPSAFDAPPPLGGSHRNIVIPFGMEKLEWLGYPMIKKIADIFIRFDATHERDRQTDRQTDGHRMTTIATLMHRIARQKRTVNVSKGGP